MTDLVNGRPQFSQAGVLGFILGMQASPPPWNSPVPFTTLDHVEKRAPLSTVDRQFTTQINRDRHVNFTLPK